MSADASLMGIAKPRPWAVDATAVLMPMTAPEASSSGPPLLPGLIAASVWMRPVSLVGARSTRRRPSRRGRGRTRCPWSRSRCRCRAGCRWRWPSRRPGRSAESAIRAGDRPVASTLISARSLSFACSTSVAGYVLPSAVSTREAGAVLDDVAVGEDVAVGGEDDPGADAGRRLAERREAVRGQAVGGDRHDRLLVGGDDGGEVVRGDRGRAGAGGRGVRGDGRRRDGRGRDQQPDDGGGATRREERGEDRGRHDAADAATGRRAAVRHHLAGRHGGTERLRRADVAADQVDGAERGGAWGGVEVGTDGPAAGVCAGPGGGASTGRSASGAGSTGCVGSVIRDALLGRCRSIAPSQCPAPEIGVRAGGAVGRPYRTRSSSTIGVQTTRPSRVIGEAAVARLSRDPLEPALPHREGGGRVGIGEGEGRTDDGHARAGRPAPGPCAGRGCARRARTGRRWRRRGPRSRAPPRRGRLRSGAGSRSATGSRATPRPPRRGRHRR